MFVMKSATTLRVARPTDHLDDVVRFYRDGVGLIDVGSFFDHEGFDGVMLGTPGASYHLEFTRQRGQVAGRSSTQENLLVFYLPAREEWQAAVDRMVRAGYAREGNANSMKCLVCSTFLNKPVYMLIGEWPHDFTTGFCRGIAGFHSFYKAL